MRQCLSSLYCHGYLSGLISVVNRNETMFNRHFAASSTKSVSVSLGFMLQCNEVYTWGQFAFSRGLKIMQMHTLLMIDWDPIAEGGEADHHYTVKDKAEVYAILDQRVKDHPDELWRVYETPSGGIHAFLLSHHYTPDEGYDILTEMRGDLLYRDFSKSFGMWRVRIGPKPGRVGDFIARYVGTWGSGAPLPEHLESIRVHDSFLP